MGPECCYNVAAKLRNKRQMLMNTTVRERWGVAKALVGRRERRGWSRGAQAHRKGDAPVYIYVA